MENSTLTKTEKREAGDNKGFLDKTFILAV
jgi:hypothetical protein